MQLSEAELIETIENIRDKLMTKMTPGQKADWHFLLDRFEGKLQQLKKLNNAFLTTTSIKQNGNR